MAVSSEVTTSYSGSDATASSRQSTTRRLGQSSGTEDGSGSRSADSTDVAKSTRTNASTAKRTTGLRKQVSTKAASVTVTEQDAPDSITTQRTPVDIGVQFSFTIKVRAPAVPNKVLKLPS